MGNKTAENIKKTNSQNTREDPRKSTTTQMPQPARMPEEIYIYQEGSSKLLMNFNHYNHKCIKREWSTRRS